jgi:glycerol-3-phosphate dehydrogenase (NAD(P)+)
MAASADHDALPVTCMVSALLKGEVALPEAIERLLTRPLKRETD